MVLIIGGGIFQVPLIKEAVKNGIFAVVMDRDEHAPGMEVANDKIIQDIAHPEKAAEKAMLYHLKRKIDAVLTVGSDFTHTINKIKVALHLKALSQEMSLMFNHKFLLRKFLRKKKFPQPRFLLIEKVGDFKKVLQELRFPIVLKPVDSMGARGVMKLAKTKSIDEELGRAYSEALRYSRIKQVIAEELILGEEFSIDALIYNKKIYLQGIADRIIEFPPYFVETGHIIPSLKKKSVVDKIKKKFVEVIESFGLDYGAVKGDVFYTPTGEVVVGEVANRLSGGFMSTHTYPLSSGVNLMKAILEVNLGIKPSGLAEKKQRQVMEKAILLNEGEAKFSKVVIKKISGVEKIEKLTGVENVLFYVTIGEAVERPRNNLMKVGSIIVSGGSMEEIRATVRKIVRSLKINDKPIRSVIF